MTNTPDIDIHRVVLNPRIDANFKALFTQDTMESKEALRSFLTAAIGREIADVAVVENEPAELYAHQRQVSFDVNCKFADGERAQIEVQGSNSEYDFGLRAEYHAARLLSSQLVKGDDWSDIRKVYQISVLDFKYDLSNTEPVHHYALRGEDGSGLADALNVIFLELAKLPSVTPEEAGNLPALIKWGIFLKEADDPKKQDIIEELIRTEAGIMNAKKSLNYISEDEKKMYLQWSIDDARRDYVSNINGARRKGIAIGEERGSRAAKLEAARNLLAMHVLSAEQIAQATGLTLSEVAGLQSTQTAEQK